MRGALTLRSVYFPCDLQDKHELNDRLCQAELVWSKKCQSNAPVQSE